MPSTAKVGVLNSDTSLPARPRWGILGGTFDPPHLGHFALAESAASELGLVRVVWVPSATPPHKKDKALTPFGVRATMAEMTARRDLRFDVSRIEATLTGNSYTVKTLAHLGQALPEMDLFFIVGADVLPELADWYHPERISRWATLACGLRPGFTMPSPEDLPVARVVYFRGPELDVSSSDIRARVAAGRPFEQLVSPDVARLIREQGLYKSPD